MFYVSSIIPEKKQCVVKDTMDGVSETYHVKDLIEISKSIPYDIAGVRVIKGKYSVIAVTNPAEMLFDELKAQYHGYFSLEEYYDKKDFLTKGTFAVRDWGEWGVSEYDDSPDRYEEDYDFQCLEKKWVKRLDSIMKNFKDMFGFEFKYSVEEKNHIYFKPRYM